MANRSSVPYDLAHLSACWMQRAGGAAHRLWSHPLMTTAAPLAAPLMRATGELLERSLSPVQLAPQWGLTRAEVNGRLYGVSPRVADDQPFGALLHFDKGEAAKGQPRVFVVAPQSGNYPTLMRYVVRWMLDHADVYVTDWKNARDVPLSAGGFDIDDYTHYLLRWFEQLGDRTHVISFCQPSPLALAAVAMMESWRMESGVASLTMIAGPIDPAVNPTAVDLFARRLRMNDLRRYAVQKVGHAFSGRGRLVYPGAFQLAALISMDAERHMLNFVRQWGDLVAGRRADAEEHYQFYDEFLASMDVAAEYYLSTVERIFKNRELAEDKFHVRGVHAPLTAINETPVFAIEGGDDDTVGVGQCQAVFDLLQNLPPEKKRSHVEPDARHYELIMGPVWRKSIAPKVLDFILEHD